MKVVIAPDSFKDALRASDVAQRIAAGLRSVVGHATIDCCPIADGGEGFTEAITFGHQHAKHYSTWNAGPLGREKMQSQWVMLLDEEGDPETAVIELAAASGLELVPASERDPTKTNTRGTGRMIGEAIELGAKDILLGIGGSATNDAGVGITQALGIVFLDERGQPMIKPLASGGDLHRITAMSPADPREHFTGVPITIACDVTNPLTGPNGAAYVYAPQKGATPSQVEQLDAWLRHMAKLWREQLGVDVEHMPGAGAAGGVGGGLVAMLGAELVPGAELVLDTIGFDERIKGADLVITGEGRLDSQSLRGKAAMAVAKRCQKAGVPCLALVGSVGEGADQALDHGLSAYHVIGESLPAAESIRRTGELLEFASVKLAQDWLLK